MITLSECYDLVKHESTRPVIDSLRLYGLLTDRIPIERYPELDHTHLFQADVILTLFVANRIIGTYGLERTLLEDGTMLNYCNAGDTYATTLMHTDAAGYYVGCWGDAVEQAELSAIDELDPEYKALATFLGVGPLTISVSYDTYSSADEPGEYLVLTASDADERWDAELDSYIDECILPEIPEAFRSYFDFDAWKHDAQYDGRGHSLATYDGHESEEDVNGTTYYIYRVN